MRNKILSEKLAYFSALCFFLSAVEYVIPKPVPFFRIGFANIPLMLSLSVFTKREVFVLCFSKIFFQAVISGTFFSYIFVFSFAGTFASVCAMMLVYNLLSKKNLVSWIGVCAAGAFANNVVQLLLSYFYIFGSSTRLIAPWILLVSLISSILLGIFANIFCSKSLWWKNKFFLEDAFYKRKKSADSFDDLKYKNRFSIISAFVSFAAVIALIFFRNLFVSAAIFVSFVILVFIKNKKVKLLPSAILIVSVTLFELLVPNGKVIFEIGSVKITQGALLLGMNRALRLCCFVFISKYFISSNFVLPGQAGIFFKKVMNHYASLNSTETKFSFRHFVESIDSVLCKIN